MSIHKIMTNVSSTRWDITDDFKFSFNNSNPLPDIQGLRGQDILDMCIINVDIPQLSAPVEPIITGGEYRLVSKKFDVFIINLTFRDTQGMKLREYFTDIWMKQQTEYYDDIKSTVEIYSKKDLVFKSTDCLVSSVSQIQFDNNNTQISEFTVELTSSFYTNSQTKDFGSFGETGFGRIL